MFLSRDAYDTLVEEAGCGSAALVRLEAIDPIITRLEHKVKAQTEAIKRLEDTLQLLLLEQDLDVEVIPAVPERVVPAKPEFIRLRSLRAA